MEQVFFKNIQEVIIRELQHAQRSIQVAVCWFSNRQIFDVLLEKTKQGLHVQLVLLDDYVNKRVEGLPLNILIDAGAKLYFSDKTAPIHHKFCIIDGSTLLNGSYDWTYFSESKALENILLIKDNQEIIKAFEAEFEMMTSVLTAVKKVVPYTMAEGLINDNFGLKHYLSEDVYLQALKAGEAGDDMNALALMHHSAQIDEYKAEVQQEFIKEKTQIEEIEEASEEEKPVYTSRGLGIVTTNYEPTIQEKENYQEILTNMENEGQGAEASNDILENQQDSVTVEEGEYQPQPIDESEHTETLDFSENQGEAMEHDATDTHLEENPAPAFNPEAESIIQQGEFAYQQGRLEEAVQFFLQAIQIQPNNPKAYLNIAIVKWRQGKFHEQAQFALQSLLYDTKNARAYNTLGLAQDRLGNHAEAIENYTKALELSPDNYSYLWNRGLALKAIGKRQEAVVDMGRVVKLCNQVLMNQPSNQNARQTLAAAMKEIGT
jgi:tetratricopeptide (TPR) repeat protein